MPTKLLKYPPIILLASSCTVALPEFQTAASLAPRENKLAVAAFQERSKCKHRGVAVYNEVPQPIDLATTTSISRLNIEQDNLASRSHGPKWSHPIKSGLSAPWELSIPKLNDIDAGYTVFTPTLYRSWANESGVVTHTFFARSEAVSQRVSWEVVGTGQRLWAT